MTLFVWAFLEVFAYLVSLPALADGWTAYREQTRGTVWRCRWVRGLA